MLTAWKNHTVWVCQFNPAPSTQLFIFLMNDISDLIPDFLSFRDEYAKSKSVNEQPFIFCHCYIVFHSLDFVLFGLLQQSGKGNNEMFWKTSCPGLNLDLMFPHTWTLKFNCISHITERRNNLKNTTKTPRHNPSPTTITCFHELTHFCTLSLNAMDLYSATLGGPLWWGFNQQTLRGRGTA